MTITALTCTGGRPEAFELCKKYMARQTRQPDQWLVLDGPQTMREKVIAALEAGQIQGDAIVFFEDDDAYKPEWIGWCAKALKKFDIVGEGCSLYYNVRYRWWSNCKNTRHASLCQTAISLEAYLALYNTAQAFDNQYFDCRLWRIELPKFLRLPENDQDRHVIGIKGMPGSAGYSSEHRQPHPDGSIQDPSLLDLWGLIGEDALNYAPFYGNVPE